MKAILSLIISGALVVSGYSQTRNVLVGTNNAVVQPTNFWSADASNARTGLGLGTSATNSASAFQPSSAILSNLATGNGGGLTNITATIVGTNISITNISGLQAALDGKLATNGSAAGLISFPTAVLQTNSSLSIFPEGLLRTNGSAIGLTNFPIIPVTSGGTGGTNAQTARNGIGLGTTNTLTIAGLVSQNLTIESGGGITLQAVLTNAGSFRTNIGLPWGGLTNGDAASFRTELGLGTAATNASYAFQPSSSALTNISSGNGGSLTNLQATNLVGIIPASNISTVTLSNIGGTLPIAQGGTAATNVVSARANLGSTVVGDAVFVATNAAAARTAIGATTIGSGIFTLANPSAITFLRVNADNTVSSLSDVNFRAAIGLGTAATNSASSFQAFSTNLTSLSANNGASLTNIPLSGVVNALASNGNAINLTNLTAANITGTVALASNITGTIAISNGGSGATTAGGARTNLGLGWSALTNTNSSTSLLGFTTNGQVVANTGTNLLSFANNVKVFDTLIEDAKISWDSAFINFEERVFEAGSGFWQFNQPPIFADAAGTRTNLGLGATWLTNTNATNFRTAIGLGTTNDVTFKSVSATSIVYEGGGPTAINLADGILRNVSQSVLEFGDPVAIYAYLPIGFVSNSFAASTRTNLGLPLPALTNTNNANFRAAINLGWSALTNSNAGTGLVSVDTNGEVVSPTNFWQVAPIVTRFVEFDPATNATTNIVAARNLHIHNLAISRVGVTSTIALPITNSLNGDIALVVHKGPTSSVTAVRTAGAATNLVTMNQPEQTVEFVYYNNVWQFNHNRSFVEHIYFSGTNATANAAASRTNLGLGTTNDVTFSSLTLSSDLTLNSGDNIVLSTTNGTKIGTATNQLLGFYDQTPITQPSSTGVTTNGYTQNSGNNIHPSSTFTGGIGTNAYTISDVVAHLKSLGLLAP